MERRRRRAPPLGRCPPRGASRRPYRFFAGGGGATNGRRRRASSSATGGAGYAVGRLRCAAADGLRGGEAPAVEAAAAVRPERQGPHVARGGGGCVLAAQAFAQSHRAAHQRHVRVLTGRSSFMCLVSSDRHVYLRI